MRWNLTMITPPPPLLLLLLLLPLHALRPGPRLMTDRLARRQCMQAPSRLYLARQPISIVYYLHSSNHRALDSRPAPVSGVVTG